VVVSERGRQKVGLSYINVACGHLPNLVNPPRESVHNSPRLLNEHNLLSCYIIITCMVSESAFKVYI